MAINKKLPNWDVLQSPILLTTRAKEKVNKKVFNALKVEVPSHENLYLCPLTAEEVDASYPIVFDSDKEDKGDDAGDAAFELRSESFYYSLLLHHSYGVIPISSDEKLHLEDLFKKFLREDAKKKKTGKLPEFIVSYGKITANDEKDYQGFFITELAFDSEGYFAKLRKKKLDQTPEVIVASFMDYLDSIRKVVRFNLCCYKKSKKNITDATEEIDKIEEPFVTPEIEGRMTKKVKKMNCKEMRKLIKKNNKKLSETDRFKGPWNKRSPMETFILRNDLLAHDEETVEEILSEPTGDLLETGQEI